MDVDGAGERPLELEQADLVAVVVGSRAAAALDARLGGRLERLRATGELPAKPGDALVLHLAGEIASPRLALLGIGPREDVSAAVFRAAGGALAAAAGDAVSSAAVALDPDLGLTEEAQAAAVAEGVVLAGHRLDLWRSTPPAGGAIETLLLAGAGDRGVAAARRAATVARWTNRARTMTAAPPNLMNPGAVLAEAKAVAGPTVTCELLGRAELERGGFGGVLAVAGGAASEPGLAVLRYVPRSGPTAIRLGIVGKAVTFDSGGLFLKPQPAIVTQKTDMAGGAAALAALGAIAELELPVEAVAVVPAAESLLGGGAFRPGDVVTLLSGDTVEVVNPDAEGRLLLADGLVHARSLGVTHLVDVATLTGAVVAMFGDLYGALFANDDALAAEIEAAGVETGEEVWRLPLDPRHRAILRSEIADVKNSPGKGRAVGLFSGLFLERFSGGLPFAHLDVASVARSEERRDALPPGPTGFGVRLLVELARRLATAERR